MTRALSANTDISFELTPDLLPDPTTAEILDDTEQLLQIRRANMSAEEKKKAAMKTRTSPRITRKLRFSKDVAVEEMDTSN
jgi:hypothetical protein